MMGVDFRTNILVSSHSLYFSVSKSLPWSLSYSLLNILITTPTKRFIKKKAPMIVKNM